MRTEQEVKAELTTATEIVRALQVELTQIREANAEASSKYKIGDVCAFDRVREKWSGSKWSTTRRIVSTKTTEIRIVLPTSVVKSSGIKNNRNEPKQTGIGGTGS